MCVTPYDVVDGYYRFVTFMLNLTVEIIHFHCISYESDVHTHSQL